MIQCPRSTCVSVLNYSFFCTNRPSFEANIPQKPTMTPPRVTPLPLQLAVSPSPSLWSSPSRRCPACPTTWPRSHQAPQHPATAPSWSCTSSYSCCTREGRLSAQAEPCARRPGRCYIHPEFPLSQLSTLTWRPTSRLSLISNSTVIRCVWLQPWLYSSEMRGTDMALLRQTRKRALWPPCRRRRNAAAPNNSRIEGGCFAYGHHLRQQLWIRPKR